MVARVLFPVLTWRGNALTPPPPGDHQGPPHIHSSALAPTDHPASYLSSRLSLMPIGGPSWSPAVVRSRVRRRHNAFRIGPAIRRSIESDCFSLDQIIVFFSPAI